MTWIEQYWLQLLFALSYFALLIHHCLKGKQETHGTADFLTARGKLGGWVIALSFYATFVSTNSFVGHAGKSWDVGLIWYVKGIVIVLSCYVAWYLVAPRFFRTAREWNSLTVPDFLGYRYDSLLLRRISAVVIFAAAALYLIAVYKGSSLALQQFLGLDYHLAAVAIFLVVTAYTLTGGFRAGRADRCCPGPPDGCRRRRDAWRCPLQRRWPGSYCGSDSCTGSRARFLEREDADAGNPRPVAGRRDEAAGRPPTDIANLRAQG